MSSVQMYWGSSDVPSGVPNGLDVQFNPATGRGLQVDGTFNGPGCGSFLCGESRADLTYLGRFFLQPERMPTSGSLFVSAPTVEFSGRLNSWVLGRAEWDYSSVRVGLRVRQYVYSGGTRIGMKERTMPRIIDCSWDDQIENYTLPDVVSIPNCVFVLNKTRPLQIDVEVRFHMRVEGDANVSYWSHGGRSFPDEFVFDVPQWFIESTSSSIHEDDYRRELEPPPPGRYRK